MILRQLKLPDQIEEGEPSPSLREQLEADLTIVQQNLSALHADNMGFRKRLSHLDELRINNLKRQGAQHEKGVVVIDSDETSDE
jgi:hypothetical protein